MYFYDAQNHSESEEMNQNEESKVLVAEYSSEKDFSSLSSITNQTATNTVIPVKVETKNSIESEIVSSDRNSSKTISNEHLQNIKTESTSLVDVIAIFSDEVIQSNIEDQSKQECSSTEDATNTNTNINKSKWHQTHL